MKCKTLLLVLTVMSIFAACEGTHEKTLAEENPDSVMDVLFTEISAGYAHTLAIAVDGTTSVLPRIALA